MIALAMSGLPPDHRSDQQLIAAVQGGDAGGNGGGDGGGDETAFAVLYHRHKDFALRIAWRYSTCDADALDAVQSAFVYLAGRLAPGVSPAFILTAKLSTFLFPVVKHEALAIRRKAARMRLGADIGNEAAANAVFDELPARDAPPDAGLSARRVASAIKSLPAAQREVILLRFIDELSMEEISSVLAVPVGTVKSRLHNAMKALAADAEAVTALIEGK